MDKKGKALLIESPVGLISTLVLDDEQSLQGIVTSFENCCHPCKVISEHDGLGTILRSYDGSCAYLVKPIPLRDLNRHMNLKRKNDFSLDVSRAKKPRMSWTPLMREKFEESVPVLGGSKEATPMKILKRMKTKGNFEDLTREQVSSRLQKYRLKLQKEVPQSHKDKDGTSSLHVEANSCAIGGQPFGEDFPLPDDLFHGLTKVDTGNIFGDPNQLDILSQQQQAPSANILSLTIEGNTSSTICGNQSNTSMTQMAQAPSSELIWNEFSYLDTLQGGIYGDPDFFDNAPVPSSSEDYVSRWFT